MNKIFRTSDQQITSETGAEAYFKYGINLDETPDLWYMFTLAKEDIAYKFEKMRKLQHICPNENSDEAGRPLDEWERRNKDIASAELYIKERLCKLLFCCQACGGMSCLIDVRYTCLPTPDECNFRVVAIAVVDGMCGYYVFSDSREYLEFLANEAQYKQLW